METSRTRLCLFVFYISALLFSVSIIAVLPQAWAGNNIMVTAFLSVEPNPIGIGQQVSINLWLLPPSPLSGAYHGLSVQITKPDGNTQTIQNIDASMMGSSKLVYVPDQVGTWSFQVNYPGETLGNLVVSASQSPKTVLTVQQLPVPSFSDYPLPASNQNWTFPISGVNGLWSSVSGNWLMRGYNESYSSASDVVSAFNPYTLAPRSAHVVWADPIAVGGLVGGEYGSTSYYSGLPYEDKLSPPVIIDGRVYYNLYFSAGSSVLPGFVCLDLRTGAELWQSNNTQITCGQLYNFESDSQSGVVGPYLWGTETTTYYMYDANTGGLILSFANAVPSGPSTSNPIVFSGDGTMLVYFFDSRDGWLAMWNSTKAFKANGMIPVDPATEIASWRPKSGVYDWRTGIEWNVSTTPFTGQNSGLSSSSGAIQGVCGGVIVALGTGANGYEFHSAYSSTTGQQLWSFDRGQSGTHAFTKVTAFGEGIYAQFDSVAMSFVAYDLYTGKELWQSDPASYPWGAFIGGATIAYDKLYSTSADGHVYAFSAKNGAKVWSFASENSTETMYGNYPFRYGPLVANGTVYASTGEQFPTQPLYKDERLYAIDANTGKGLWNISGSFNLGAIADGYLLAYKGDDNRIYCFGKGETTTTVSLSSNIVENGTKVLIQGTITDNSPAEPNTPCVSRDYMGGWLQYLLMQKPCPYATIPGVAVEVRVMFSNGTVRSLGLPVSSEYGRFNFTWTPPGPGTYALLARFPGDDSYYVTFDWAEADLLVTPTLSTPQTVATTSPSITVVDIAILVAVVITAVLSLFAIYEVRRLRGNR